MNAEKFFETIKFFGDPNIPENSDFATIYGAYIRQLAQYPSEILQLAADTMIETRKHRNFPLPKECTQWCDQADRVITGRREREAAKSGRRQEKHSDDPWSPWRIKQADKMMDSAQGRLAAEEGWIIHLHDFCREQGRLPNEREAGGVRAAGLRLKAERDEMDRIATPAMLALIGSAKRAMTAKRSRLSSIALRKDAA